MMYRVASCLALSVLFSSNAIAQSAAASIRAGDSISGTLSASDTRSADGKPFKVYRLEGEPGKRYLITLHSDAFDAYLRVGRTVGGITDYVETDDDSGDGTDAQISLPSPSRSSYVIVVTSADDTAAKGGAFTLQLAERLDHPVVVRPIVVGDSAAGTLDQNTATWNNSQFPYVLYTFPGKKGQQVVARLRVDSGTADVTMGRISNGKFSSLGNSTGVTRVRNYTPTQDGEYAVRVMVSRPTAYVLRLNEAIQEPVRTLRINSSVVDTLQKKAGDIPSFHNWTFSAERNQRLAITVLSKQFRPFITLNRLDRDSVVSIATGVRATTADVAPGMNGSRIEAVARVAGEYQVHVESIDSVGGTYALSATTLLDVPQRFRRGSIASGQEVKSTLAETDSTLDDGSPFQEWTYEVKQPKERVTFTMRSSEFDTFLSVGRIEGGKFVEFSSNDDAGEDTTNYRVSRVTIVAPAAGTFVVRANSMAINQTGAYTLRAGPPEAENRIAYAMQTAVRAQSFARRAMIAEAIAAIDSALLYDSTHVTNDQLNTICWFGSLQNQASRVISYCDRAVRLDPAQTGIRDSRGVARALMGNVSGAIEDFRAYAEDQSKDTASRSQRLSWLTALQHGRPPQEVFSEEVRTALARQ
ncbi:MAG TPA: tetratricopeptide repeat protein [Gemmatimonadaceae bacterium]|nr:tetratricopeptide repeat protein [Gemmatimonadaceae bacterium]